MNPASTVLRLEGRDALELLHRVTTQHLRDLEPGQSRATLFCDHRGRLQHRVAIAVTSDRAVWMLRDDAPGEPLAALLAGQIFREDVRLADLGGRWVVGAVATSELVPGTMREADGRPIELRADESTSLQLEPRGVAIRGRDERERVRLGLPRHGHEISAEFHPLEVGLARDVHLDKGCFTGQESLLRLVTYGGVRRRLCLIEGSGPAPAAPRRLLREAQDAGVLTSAVAEGGGWVGLGIVRREAAERAALVTDEGALIGACVPFPEDAPLGLPSR